MELVKRNIKSILIGATLFSATTMNAQVARGSLDKLMDLYVQDNYEKCYDKARAMTENDKYKSMSEPYLYVSMCLIEFYNDSEYEEAYPNALKDALKFGAKFKKKDDKLKSKDKDYLFDENVEFMNQLKRLALQEGKAFFVQDNFRKATYFYKLGVKLDPEDPVMRMMKGVSNMNEKNTKEGQLEIDKALSQYRELAESGEFEINRDTEQGFVDGLFYYAQYLKSKNQTSDLEDVVSLARKLDPENEKFKKLYKDIMG